MKPLISILMLLSSVFASCQPKTIDGLLERYNSGSVPYLSVEELKMQPEEYQILDARTKEEYQVSHIPGAIWVGENPNKNQLKKVLDPQKPIVVYCSVGIRSEDFGEKLRDMDYLKVYNLYGSIFAWKNAGFPVVDPSGKETEKVHVYGKMWGKYLQAGEKVY